VRDGALLVGDAACQIGSLTGAGINYSLHAGKLAGRAAAESFVNGSIDYKRLKRYQKEWARGLGKQQRLSYLLKEFAVNHADDAFMNSVAHRLNKRSKKMSMTSVIMAVFARDPRMLLRAFWFTR
ncbi:MAG: hypothetical protein JW795_05390, partial [Chitinivibrionales bacterium]|nr:hypothetical protein [Chitinivibrionales bacterium]